MPSLPNNSLTEEQHYFRNKLNLEYSWEDFWKLQSRLPQNYKWIRCDDSESVYHNINTKSHNSKYISADGHFEVVFSLDYELVNEESDPLNMGTYNYYSYKTNLGNHVKYDIIPYVKYTNTKNTNTKDNRKIIFDLTINSMQERGKKAILL